MVYRVKKVDKVTGVKPKAENDAYAVLLTKLSGVGSRAPRRLSADQHWSKAHYDNLIREVFEERWTNSGRPPKELAVCRAEVTRELFRSLPQDVQDFHAQACINDHEKEVLEWKRKLSGRPSTDAEDRQK